MTSNVEVLPIDERIILSGIGRDDLTEAFARSSTVDGFVQLLGMRGLNWLIAAVLSRHYPADVFPPDGVLYPSWGGERGGDDIQPGVKWAATLRLAIEEVNREE